MTAELGFVGFEVAEEISRDAGGSVFAASQPGLQRSATIRLLAIDATDRAVRHRFDEALVTLTSLTSDALPALVAAGVGAEGPWAAFVRSPGHGLRLSRLRPLANLRALSRPARALDELHAAGLAHGSLGAAAILVDQHGAGSFRHAGLGGLSGSVEDAIQDDRRQFAALLKDARGLGVGFPADPLGPGASTAASFHAELVSRARRRWRGGCGVMGVAMLALVLVAFSSDRLRDGSAVALPDGARVIGCEGRSAPSTTECTLAQMRVGGTTAAVREDGAIRRWSVGGAAGQIALQVIRPASGGRWWTVQESQLETARGLGRQSFPANLEVRRGDVLALEVAEGATVALVPDDDSKTARWVSALRFGKRVPLRPHPEAFDGELIFDAPVVVGARQRQPLSLTGAKAVRAPEGRVVSTRGAGTLGGPLQYVNLVVVGERVFIDLVGERGVRLVRMSVPLARGDGTGSLTSFDGRADGLKVRWHNPGGELVRHSYVVGPQRLAYVD